MMTKVMFAALTMLVLFAGYGYAQGLGNYDRVDGYVTDDGAYIDVTFTATCTDDDNIAHNAEIHKYNLIDSNGASKGRYLLYLDCDAGRKACITATEKAGDRSVTGCGSMLPHSPGNAFNSTYIDLVFTDTDPVPEFGLIAIPLLLSMAGFVFMRGRL